MDFVSQLRCGDRYELPTFSRQICYKQIRIAYLVGVGRGVNYVLTCDEHITRYEESGSQRPRAHSPIHRALANDAKDHVPHIENDFGE